MSDPGKREYFNSLAPRWDAMPWPADRDARVADFCRRALPPAAAVILDAGSGTGLLAPHLLTQPGNSPALVVELDYALAMLQASAAKHGNGRVAHVCGDALRLPFGDATMDAVLCFGILPHLGDPGRAVRELWRVLRPAGAIAVGHLLGSAELNRRHREIGGPVGGDTLLPGDELAEMLRGLGASEVEAEDSPACYLVCARKGGR